VVLLRGVNLGPRNRIAMPRLREVFSAAGFGDVRTYVQSGNAVLLSSASPDEVARTCERVIATELGLEIDIVTRTRDELAGVIRLDLLGDVATNPKRYQVTFLGAELDPSVVQKIENAAAAPEQVVVAGREIYTWHADGIGRSKLAVLLAGRGLGVAATARNWTTVTSLLALADQ
jgi:uncharacterized protein (DUF1697 family)